MTTMKSSSSYTIGSSYPFKVKSVFSNYCEIQHDNTVAYLQNTNNLRLVKGQILDCKIVSNTSAHPKVEILNIGDIDHKETMISDKVLTQILSDMNISWPSRDFVKLVLTDEDDISFERSCHLWIETLIEIQQDLCTIKTDCQRLLELSPLLDRASYAEREIYQERLTKVIELVGYYILAKDLLEEIEGETEDKAQKYVDEILLKLETSGYVYHPTKAFNILSSMFVLNPDLMTDNIKKVFSIIKKREIIQWKKEPFRSALIQVLEMYVSGNERQLDRIKDKSLILYNTIQAIAIQLLLHDRQNGDTDIIDYRLNASRLCNFVSYANMANPVGIVNLALFNLVSTDYVLPPYTLLTVGTDRFPFFISDAASKLKDKIDTVSTFVHNNVRLTISNKGIELSSTAHNVKAVLPKTLNLWNNLQVLLSSKLDSGSGLSGVKKGIIRYKNLWNNIERELFESSQKEISSLGLKNRRKVGDHVNITIQRQDVKDADKFYCSIEDKLGGEGIIYIQDIVPYAVPHPSVRHFISDKGSRLIFKAQIIDATDGEYHFSMSDFIREEAEQFYYDDEDIICYVGANQSGNHGFLPGITKEGISATLKGLENIDGLRKGNMIAARLIGPAQDGFHIDAKVLHTVNQDFNIYDSFHFLMKELAVGEVNPIQEDNEVIETDRILDVSYVRQLIYIIDRISVLDNTDNEYIKSYNYLGFARMLCLMISWEEQAAYYKGRMDIILMLHDFAINDKVDEQSLAQLESMNADLFSSNVVLRNRFRQLQIVSFIGKPEYNQELWDASRDSDSSISELASLVLSYNFMTSTNMDSQATDIHNRIKQTLRLKGYESGLKMYGTGIEDKTTEYKTSIVYLADKSCDIPNMQEQMKVILSVIDSFLNTDGGTLYIGVNDTGMGVGIEGDLSYFEFNGDKDKYARTITDAVVYAFGKVVATHVDVKFDPDGDKPVCIVKVTPYKEGVHFNGIWYVRIGSTKRKMSKDEFKIYNDSERVIIENKDVPDVKMTEPKDAELSKESVPTTPAIELNSLADTIPTSQIRFNVLEDYSSDYRPTIGYMQFLDKGKFRKMTEYNWSTELLTLAVYDEDKDGYLILAYDDGYVAKVPVHEIMKFADNHSHSRYNQANLIFASIAHNDDALMTVTEEDKGKTGRVMVRIDSLSRIEDAKLSEYGERFFNEGLARRIVQIDVIPASDKAIFKHVCDQDMRTLGLPVRTLSADLKEGFAKLGITINI